MSVSRALEAHPRDLAPSVAAAIPVASRRIGRSRDETKPVFSQPLVPMATACAVAMLTLLTVRFGVSSNGVVVIWLANAVATAMWLRGGKGTAFDVCFGGLVAVGIAVGELLFGYPPLPAMMLTAVNLLEIGTAVFLVRRFAPGMSLSTVKSTITLIGVSALLAPMIGGVGGAVALAAIKGVPLLMGFQMWWFGHALGMMLIVPLILGVNTAGLFRLARPAHLVEAVVLMTAVVGVGYLCYVLKVGSISAVMNMLLVIIAARLRMGGVTLAMLTLSIMMFWTLLHGSMLPAYAALDPGSRLMTGQLTMLSVSLPFMLVAALLNQVDGLTARARLGQRRAEQASESKSRLLANVAHEIKSPVAGVIGIGELWSNGTLGPVTATQKEMADMLVKTARQVETLAHDLLDVARAESGSVKVEL